MISSGLSVDSSIWWIRDWEFSDLPPELVKDLGGGIPTLTGNRSGHGGVALV